MNRVTRGEGTARRGLLFVVFVLVGLMTAPQLAHACAVCYGDADSAMTQGMNNGILVLLGVVAGVQIAFVALFLSLRQRARQMREEKERFQLIQGGAG